MTDGERVLAPAAGEVTVVVVTWEQRDLVLACLESLAGQTVAHRILVVDNASTDGTAEAVDAHFPHARVLPQTSNLGFAGGVSAALDMVDTRFVALLNNDAQADPRWLEASMVALADPSVVAVTAKLLLAEPGPSAKPASRRALPLNESPVDPATVDAATINNAGVVLLASGYGADRGLGSADDERFASPVEVFGFSGGAVVMRTMAVKAAGGFDPDFFMYYEDTDLSWRLRLAGWRIVYAPDAVVHHLHAASSDARSEMFAFHNERNRLLMLLRDAPLAFAISKIARFALTTASLTGKRLTSKQLTSKRLTSKRLSGRQLSGKRLSGRQLSGKRPTGRQLSGRRMGGRAVPDDQVFRPGLRLRVLAAVLSRLPATLRKRRGVPRGRRRAEVLQAWVGVTERPLNEEG